MSTFWGLTLEAGKRYTQTVAKSFHVSMAALDVKSSDSADVSVYVGIEKIDFLICNLSKQKLPQQALDLNFTAGDKIAFSSKGKGAVHLTGYVIPDDDMSMMDEADEEEVSDDEGMTEEEFKQFEERVKAAYKQKHSLSKDEDKKRKLESDKSKQEVKKPKMDVAKQDDDDSEDESEDESLDEEAGSEEASDEDLEMVEAESDSDMDEESGDEDEEEDDDEEDEKEKVTVQSPKKKQDKQKTPVKLMNGNAKLTDSAKKNNLHDKTQTPKSAKKDNQTPGKNKTPGKNAETPSKSKETPGKGQDNSASPGSAQKKIQQLQGGVRVEDSVVGKGPEAKIGKMATVYYTGRLKSNNKVFDSSQSGAGFRFRLGKGEVIKGWDIGVTGMKVGGKRRITCPPHAAYGQKGSPPVIPPNSTLVFDVELKNVS